METTADISKITIGERFRKELGDLHELECSIQEVGLLHPIVIDGSLNLIAGWRRLMACKHLGWKTIPVTVLSADDPREAERDENAARKDFTPSEAVAIKKYFESGEHEAALERVAEGRHKARSKESTKFATSKPKPVREKVAEMTGLSHETLKKAEVVIDAAKIEPELEKLVEQMDETGKVDPVYQALKEERPELVEELREAPTRPAPTLADKQEQLLNEMKNTWVLLFPPSRADFLNWARLH